MRSPRRLDPPRLGRLLVVWTVAWSVPAGADRRGHEERPLRRPVGVPRARAAPVGPAGHVGRSRTRPTATSSPWVRSSGSGPRSLPGLGGPAAVVDAAAHRRLPRRWSGCSARSSIGDAADARRRALAYVLAPRVVSTIGGLSAEARPQLLAPAVLWPLVLVDRGRLSARSRRCPERPGRPVLRRGQRRRDGVRRPPAGAVAAHPRAGGGARVTWWVGPGRRRRDGLVARCRCWCWAGTRPPFLDWIENAPRGDRPRSALLDVVRGTTHWLGARRHPGGPWWPAGYQLVDLTGAITGRHCCRRGARVWPASPLAAMPAPRVSSSAAARRGARDLAAATTGLWPSPFVAQAQMLLDGPLAPLRNVHKADLLVRLPLALGLAHLLGLVAAWRPGARGRAWLVWAPRRSSPSRLRPRPSAVPSRRGGRSTRCPSTGGRRALARRRRRWPRPHRARQRTSASTPGDAPIDEPLRPSDVCRVCRP